jgi:hypothetical protein
MLHYLVGLLLVSPVWALVSTRLFMETWFSLYAAVVSAVGLVRGTADRRVSLRGVFLYLATMAASVLLLWLGQYLLADVMGFGFTISETIVYWTCAFLAAWYYTSGMLIKGRSIWKDATMPEALKEDALKLQ